MVKMQSISGRVLVLSLVVILLFCGSVWAESFAFNGTVKDTSGNALNAVLVNVTIRDSTYTLVGSNTTTTNASGWFNLTVTGPDNGFYQPVITLINRSFSNVNFTQFIGQSLPSFPSMVFNELGGTTFYLRDAGTIAVTAVNETGSPVAFTYQIKDTKLGYPVAKEWQNLVFSVNITVPKDRNYSIIIFPNQSMPVSFDWNNFSTTNSYSFTPGASSYNATTKVLNKQFNITLRLDRVSGYVNYSGIDGWSNLGVVAYLMEPGNMISAEYGELPYNLSSAVGTSDLINATSGFFNISLPATVETSNILLFATTRNGTRYFGAFRNVSLTYGSAVTETRNFNFTAMSGLMGTNSSISLNTLSGTNVNIPTARQNFTLINATNTTLSNLYAHVEVTLDYSSIGGTEFTWMTGPQQDDGIATFSVILLNNTGIKEMNVYAGGGSANYAPKRTAPTVAEILANNNITMKSFNPGAIDSQLSASQIRMVLYISNSTCDVPTPPTSCLIGGTEKDMSTFNPMSALLGGGKLSFRMGTGNITVHYVNVDMMASGPPDALFDNNVNNNSGSTFDAAVRFGSGGPSIYDFVLVSMPYAETAGTGLNESAPVNMSIPVLYDDNWNVLWNASLNGTNASVLAGNYSHYEARESEWASLLATSTCTQNVTLFNATTPCFINTTENLIWIRLPHFSGTGPSVSGSVVAAAPSSSSSSSSSGSGSGTGDTGFWKTTIAYDSKELQDFSSVSRELREKERLRIKIGGSIHHVGITSYASNQITINVSSEPQSATLAPGESKKFEITNDSYYDIAVMLVSINATTKRANLSISYIHEEIIAPVNETTSAETSTSTEGNNTPAAKPENERSSAGIITLVVIILVILLCIGIAFKVRETQSLRTRVKIKQESRKIKVH
ncbi:hypothetical protein HYZ97_00735 [Candidatus Pacearchaeota archaeon]|nr:hypothetical protein [Candidatus Pacearchaeota archaeon]